MANGHCRHHWLLSDPVYVWQDGKYMELTHQTCLHCDTERDNLCPLAPEQWIDDLVIAPMRVARFAASVEE